MSLIDTIKGAREEAEASGLTFDRKKERDEEGDDIQAAPSSRGMARRSAARARPKREAAAGVRVVNTGGGKSKARSSKPVSEMTKEERKAERKVERELEDRRYTLTQAFINESEEYKRARKNWWKFLGTGIALVVVAFTLYGFVNQAGENANPTIAIMSGVTIALSYVAIIGALVYDWVKIRPLRKKEEQRVASMSDKKVKNILDQKAREQAKEEAAKEAAKEARKQRKKR